MTSWPASTALIGQPAADVAGTPDDQNVSHGSFTTSTGRKRARRIPCPIVGSWRLPAAASTLSDATFSGTRGPVRARLVLHPQTHDGPRCRGQVRNGPGIGRVITIPGARRGSWRAFSPAGPVVGEDRELEPVGLG